MKTKKRPKRRGSTVEIDGKRVRAKVKFEFEKPPPVEFYNPPLSVEIGRSKNGAALTLSKSYGHELIRRSADGKFDIAALLDSLARTIAGTDRAEEISAEVFVLVRRTPELLRRPNSETILVKSQVTPELNGIYRRCEQ